MMEGAFLEIEGLEEFTDFLKDLTITEADEKKAMRMAIEPIAKEVENNTPEGDTERLEKIKKTVKKEGFATVGTVKLGMYYGMFQEFGTSQQKRNVGFFDRSVTSKQDEALRILSEQVMSKIK